MTEKVLFVTCVACGKLDNVSPSPARDLFLWGVRDFYWLRPTVLCHQCLWEIQSRVADGAGWNWLQSRLPAKARGERDDAENLEDVRDLAETGVQRGGLVTP